ncbi:hypothetical protein CC80DRAFT_474478 [Byssothecium circinans]|uniref:Uncharacterized protein n=1 Tax=Byssothecium circinans TaxID=147558 RepID=A0A6A5TS96_9PLEO|nr:hypothetical protein CC80DRAFT_474478 [Byssothecium circinans]
MVKTNRFVQVQSSGPLALRTLLNTARVPLVTTSKRSVEHFQGFVLSVSLDLASEYSAKADQAVILSRDLNIFCQSVMDGDLIMPGYSTRLAMTITVAPTLTDTPLRYKEPLATFFTEKTQENLLRPLQTGLRGIKNIRIAGHVAPAIAKVARGTISQDESSNAQKVLENMINEKEKGQNRFHQGALDEACMIWLDTAAEIEKLHAGSSWASLIDQSDEVFIAKIAEIYFLLKLNIAHVQLTGMERPVPGLFALGMLASDALDCAVRSLRKDYWKKDFRWRPSAVHKAKMYYRYAVYWRLEGGKGTLKEALKFINKARELVPNDAAVVREHEKILAGCD